MNKSQLVLAAIPAALAMAAPNLALSNGNGKSGGHRSDNFTHIHHCGCNDAGTDLVCKGIDVNTNSLDKGKGHDLHTVGTDVFCTASSLTWRRTKADCGIGLPAGSCGGSSECVTPGDDCGVAP